MNIFAGHKCPPDHMNSLEHEQYNIRSRVPSVMFNSRVLPYLESRHLFNYSNHLLTRNTLGSLRLRDNSTVYYISLITLRVFTR